MPTILVPVADRPECTHALNVSLDLGKRLNASVIGCHILAHRDSDKSLSSSFSAEYFTTDHSLLGKTWQSRSNIKSSTAAKKLFNHLVLAKDYTMRKRLTSSACAVWQEQFGSPDKIMRIVGPVNDLIVVTRPASKKADIARLFMLSAVMASGRPVLILPQRKIKTIGKRVLIAWNQSAEAARAVASNLHLLKAAERVNITVCGRENQLGPKASQLRAYLTSWGIKSNVIKKPGKNTEKELIDAFQESQSDVLLMGAYSRRRWRELVFGGTSQYMLEKASIPVLMMHS